MQEIETKHEVIERDIHKFYCDNCNKFLGESIEFEDGYYEEYGEYELKIFFKKDWYVLNKTLCGECTDKLNKEIKQKLLDLGFEE